jgi:ATP-dependent Clp protease ATP-binding subunit ClpX
MNQNSLGFRASIESRKEKSADIFAHVLPEDLMKYGLIPEFIGRLPVVSTLSPLDEDALVRILTEPKNALTKQYQKFFDFDGVDLAFHPDALTAIAGEAIQRGTGARALRTIIEEVMLNIMYDIPSNARAVSRVVIGGDTVRERKDPKSCRPSTCAKRRSSAPTALRACLAFP